MTTPNIQDQMAAALAQQAGENVQDVQERVASAEGNAQSKLAAMINQTKAAAKEKKIVRTQTAAPKRVKAEKVGSDIRDVVVIKSETAMTAFVVCNKYYTNKPANKFAEFARKGLAARKNLGDFLAQEDLMGYHAEQNFTDDLADEMKAKTHDALVAEGYKVLSIRPRSVPLQVIEETVQDETTNTEV